MGFKLGEQFVSAQDPPKLEDNDSWEEEPVTEEQRGAKVEPEADHVSLVESIEVPKRRASGPSISPRVSKGSIEDTAQNLNSIGKNLSLQVDDFQDKSANLLRVKLGSGCLGGTVRLPQQ